MRAWIVLLFACGGDQAAAVPPGVVLAPPSPKTRKTAATKPVAKPAPIVDAGAPHSPVAVEAFCPVNPAFIDIKKTRVDHVACETRALFVVKGKATADKDALAAGDVLITQGKGGYDLAGDGTGLLAIVQPPNCEPNQFTSLTRKIVRGKDVPALTWGNGAMSAHLDVEGAAATVAYMGRLEGTAAVAEHTHDSSWEVLCAVEAQGTFTLAGTPQKLGPKTCVKVPPKTPHSWAPDPNSKLVAIQFYTPPGPEQRFKTLAATDAGAKPIATDAGKR